MSSSGLAWWCRKQSIEHLRDELARATLLEADQRDRMRTDPDHSATYQLTVDRCIERQQAIQSELDRRAV